MINSVSHQNTILPGDFTGQAKPENLQQASEQFEAIFLRSMLKQMRQASDVLGEDNPFNSKQQRVMRDFYDDKLALQLASQGNSGIARMIVEQLSPDDGQALKIIADQTAL